MSKVVFHEKAGTIKDKTDRLVVLSGYLADATGVSRETRARALEAARLAKADQVSIMVREFADLEGVMGETYALMEGRTPRSPRLCGSNSCPTRLEERCRPG